MPSKAATSSQGEHLGAVQEGVGFRGAQEGHKRLYRLEPGSAAEAADKLAQCGEGKGPVGKRWKALPEAERAKWRSSAPAPVPSPSDVDSFYSQTPTTVHAAPPAAPNPSAASITSANKNWLMTMLSELDNDVIMDLIFNPKVLFQGPSWHAVSRPFVPTPAIP